MSGSHQGLNMNYADQPVYDNFAVDSRSTVNQLAAANPCHAHASYFYFYVQSETNFCGS
jgi:hypothetical protein